MVVVGVGVGAEVAVVVAVVVVVGVAVVVVVGVGVGVAVVVGMTAQPQITKENRVSDNQWLQNLKVGDLVLRTRSYINRHDDGWQRGGGSVYSRQLLREATPEALAREFAGQEADKIASETTRERFRALPLAILRQISARIESTTPTGNKP